MRFGPDPASPDFLAALALARRNSRLGNWRARLLAALVVPGILLLSVWQIGRSRDAAMNEADILVTALARVAEEHIAGVMRGFDHVLGEMAEMADGDGRIDPYRFKAAMAAQMSSIREIRSGFAVDATGRVTVGTMDAMSGLDLKDRGYFIALSRDPNRTLVVSEPLDARAMAVKSIIVARPLRDAEGRFRGLVAIGLDPDTFSDELRSVMPGDGGRATLFRRDGVILARLPEGDNWVGKSLAASDIYRALALAPAGSLRGRAGTDEAQRIAAYREILPFPLVIAVGKTMDAALAKWRGESLIAGCASLLLVLATVILAVLSDLRLAERQRAQQALSASESRFRMLSDRSPVGIFQTDAEGHCLYLNDRWLELAGRRRESMLGAKWCEVVHPEDRDKVREAWVNHLRSGEQFLMEMRIGGEAGALRWVRGHASALTGADGKAIGLVGTIEDVTAAKEAEQQLRLSEQKFARAFMGSPDPLSITHLDRGQFVEVNEAFCRFLGWRREECIGHNVFDLGIWVNPEDRVRAVSLVETGGQVEDFETVMRRKDGRTLITQASIQKIAVSGEDCLLFICRDVSEHRAMEARSRDLLAKLDASNKELEQFAYVASHDLQEPLRMIAGYAQMIDRRYRGKLDPEADDFIGYMVEGAKRMQAMIQDLLEYSRVDRQGGQFREFDVGKVLDDVRLNLAAALAETGGTITIDPMPSLAADRSQFVRLFQNLLGNALKYRHPDRAPQVKVAVEVADDVLTFVVSDNGIGIDRQYFDRIFQVFQRLHGREKYQGNGIGLAVCKKIVERHGGSIWLDSIPEQGTVFRFTLSRHLADMQERLSA